MFRASNQYRNVRVLGHGAFGQASLIEDIANPKKLYVVKVCNLEVIATMGRNDEYDDADGAQKLVKMAIQEAELMKNISHPNIVKVYSSFQEGNLFHMVMEYCDSGTLKQAIRQQKGQLFPEVTIRRWTAQLAMALQWLHNKKILHRDVKPDNAFLTAKCRTVKLGDFGIAKSIGDGSSSAHTMVGTPTHMAPEMWQGSRYTFKSEVWALGVIVYELMALDLPFHIPQQANFLALGMIVTSTSPEPLPETYSAELRQLVVDKLLERDDEKRPEMAQVVGDECIFPDIVAMTSVAEDNSATGGDEQEEESAVVPSPHEASLTSQQSQSSKKDIEKSGTNVALVEMGSGGSAGTGHQQIPVIENSTSIEKRCSDDNVPRKASRKKRFALIALPQLIIGIVLMCTGAIIASSIADMKDFVEATNTLNIPTPMITTSGVMHLVVGVIGIWVALRKRKSKIFLTAFLILSGLLLVVDIIGPSFALAMRENLEVAIRNVFKTSIHQYYKAKTHSDDDIDWIQKTLKCCGYMNATDWKEATAGEFRITTEIADSLTYVPDSCCSSVIAILPGHCTAELVNDKNVPSCQTGLCEQFYDDLTLIGGICAAMALLNLISMISILTVICQCRDHYDIY